jgi:anthranilate synthase component 1
MGRTEPMSQPHYAEFLSLARDYDFVPVYRRLLSDSLTPVTALAALDDGGPVCLFESVVGGEKVGRYSFVAASPIKRCYAIRDELTIVGEKGETEKTTTHDPLAVLRQHMRPTVAPNESLPPFIGGGISRSSNIRRRMTEASPTSIFRSSIRCAFLTMSAKRSRW